MMITVKCPHCNHVLLAPGKQNLCQNCWEPLNNELIKMQIQLTTYEHQRRMRGE